MHYVRLFHTVVLILLAGFCRAQLPEPDSSARPVVVRTHDGNTFIGKIIASDSLELVVQTENFGRVVMRKAFIQSIQPVSSDRAKAGADWFDTPQSVRYFASSSAHGLRKGEGLYENGWVFLNQFSYGFSDRFSLGLGLAPVYFFGQSQTSFWLIPKITIPLKDNRFNIAIGGLSGYTSGMYETDQSYFGAAYGQVTFGPPDAHLSAGAGITFSNGNWSPSPVFSLSGFLRMMPRFAILTENYRYEDYGERYTLVSIGMRYMGRSVSIDTALATDFSQYGAFNLLPWVGLRVPFGRRR